MGSQSYWSPSSISAFRAYKEGAPEKRKTWRIGAAKGRRTTAAAERSMKRRSFLTQFTDGILDVFTVCNPKFKYSPPSFLTFRPEEVGSDEDQLTTPPEDVLDNEGQNGQNRYQTIPAEGSFSEGLDGSQIRRLPIPSDGLDDRQRHPTILPEKVSVEMGLQKQQRCLATSSEAVFNDGLHNQNQDGASFSVEGLLDDEGLLDEEGLKSEKIYLTSPWEGVLNDGLDNKENDFILYIDCIIENADCNAQYVVKEMLGKGTFGQVCRCSTTDRRWKGDVAVKVVKNSPNYFRQAQSEASICLHLNEYDRNDKHPIVRILDNFVFAGHFCLVFELLRKNLFEVLRANNHRGYPLERVRQFTTQMLDGLITLQGAGVIHCDLKPENILLQRFKGDGEIKLIDFGASCMEDEVDDFRYLYIQSRHYRSPEVLLKMPYTRAIDMWSLGCISAELFLGIQLFPGECEYDLLRLMIDILGCQPPDYMIKSHHSDKGNFRFFKVTSAAPPSTQMASDEGDSSVFQFLSAAEVAARESLSQGVTREFQKSKVGRRIYFGGKKLADIIMDKPISSRKMTEEDLLEETYSRVSFVDFLRGILEFDPAKRWTPRQALQHPFLTGQPFLTPFQPPSEQVNSYRGNSGMSIDHNVHSGHWIAHSPLVAPQLLPLPFLNPRYHLPNGVYNGMGDSQGNSVNGNGISNTIGPCANGSGMPGSNYESHDSFYSSSPGTGLNCHNHGEFLRREFLAYGGGFVASPDTGPDIYHHRVNVPHNGQTLGPPSYQAVSLGGTPSHHLQHRYLHFLYSSPNNSSTFPSPGSSYIMSPYLSPCSQLTSSPSSSLSHNSPSRFGPSPYMPGGGASAPLNIPRRHRIQPPSHHPSLVGNGTDSVLGSPSWASNGTESVLRSPAAYAPQPPRRHHWRRRPQNGHTSGSYDPVIRRPGPNTSPYQLPNANGHHHSSTFPPRHMGSPALPHGDSPANHSLGAMLQLPENLYPEYSVDPRGWNSGHNSDVRLLRGHPSEASSSSSHVAAANEINNLCDEIARFPNHYANPWQRGA